MPQEETVPLHLMHFQDSVVNTGKVLLSTETLRPDQLPEHKPKTAADIQPHLRESCR